MGDPNASIPTPQPMHYRPMFAAFGKLRTNSSVTFVSQASLDAGLVAQARRRQEAAGGEEHARRHRQGLDDPQHRHPAYRGRPGDLRGPRRRRTADLRSRRPCCRWRSGIFCFRLPEWPDCSGSRKSTLYEMDFYAWLQDQATKLHARSHNDIDWENLAEEIESVGRSQKRENSQPAGKTHPSSSQMAISTRSKKRELADNDRRTANIHSRNY